MKIQEAAERLKLTKRAIKYYEELCGLFDYVEFPDLNWIFIVISDQKTPHNI